MSHFSTILRFLSFQPESRNGTSDFRLRTSDSPHSACRRNTGSALVIVLGLLSVLMLMGVAFSITMRTERGGASNMRHAAMARHTLDSAIARTMADLDAELRSYEKNGRFYGNAIPEDMVVLASGSDEDTTPINLLSHEVSRHLPSDQLASALYTPARWLPIYGGVHISNFSDADPTSEDSPVGRYAYVILNGCGNLDPNVVGREEREFGLSPKEIYPGRQSGGPVLNVNGNGTATAFLTQRNKDGHYVNMRDFLRKSVTNIVKNARIDARKAPFPITTNSFSIGSMAVDDLSPPIEVDGKKISYGTNPKGLEDPETAVAYRLPKCSLVDSKGKIRKPSMMSNDEITEIADAFAGAFYSTWTVSRGDDALPQNYPYRKNQTIPCEQVAAHVLLDAMDEDIYPGGHTGHSSDTEADGYLKNRIWSHFPCTEPVPMLDNVISIGTLEFDGFAHRQVPNENGVLVNGVATAAVWTVSIKFGCNSSLRYVGWTVPTAAAGTYDHEWSFTGIGLDEDDLPENVNDGFAKVYTEALSTLRDNLSSKKIKGSMSVRKGISGNDRRGENDLKDVFTFKIPVPMDSSIPADVLVNPNPNNPAHNGYNIIPDAFGLTVFVVGHVSRSGKLLQVAPAPISNPEEEPEDNSIRLSLILEKEKMKTTDGAFLGGSFCLDPMFAYNINSWIPTSSLGSREANGPMASLRNALTDMSNEQNSFFWRESIAGGGPNPLTWLYLADPTRKFGGKTLFQILSGVNEAGVESIVGGGSDVMWANPGGVYDDTDGAEDASLAFYLDPDALDDAPECFNRVGQLGFLPIGTCRTIALLDGFSENAGGQIVRTPRQRVLDYFTMHAPRDEGTEGSDDKHPGKPVKSALFTSRVNINPPRAVHWKKTAVDGTTKLSLESDDYNLVPLTAALSGCPLREWASGNNKMTIDWELAETLADAYAENLERDDNDARTEDVVKHWNSDGVAHDISILGRCGQPLSAPTAADLQDDPSWDTILRQETKATCDFDREGVIRNSAEMFTARQQLFTILLKADSFTPKFGYEKDAAHGTSLASVQAIVHVWRDPEPLRDAAGYPIRDKAGNAVHPYVVLDVYQF